MAAKTERPKAAPVRYPTARLLDSRALSGYQRDFAAALLPGPEYTLQEAKAILDKFFQGGGR
mgnify:CR=1 FL=1|jgi:hypothetical protein